MAYLDTDTFDVLLRDIRLYAQLQHEYRARGIGPVLARAQRDMRAAVRALRRLRPDRGMAKREPSELAKIRALRPAGPRRIWPTIDKAAFRERLAGALLGRFAGCTLGAPVEGWDIDRMQRQAEAGGDAFPPTHYWSRMPDPLADRLGVRTERFTPSKMDGVPPDDDTMYTVLGLLVLEEFGPDFTTAEVGKAWVKYLPFAFTAEKVALHSLKAGVPAEKAAQRDNPFVEWIGADIRSDPWGYVAPGWPEKAAELAHRDAYLSHRRGGIHGEMFFAAAIAAAFTVDDPIRALRIGLTEIPRASSMAKTVRWALKVAPKIKDYKQAREAVDGKFPGMHHVHTLNNACLTIWGLSIGGTDFTRVIGETVAMGLDNDCTAATAGSICGAVIGAGRIPKKWTKNFNNTAVSYLIGKRKFSIPGLLKRFARQAGRVCGS